MRELAVSGGGLTSLAFGSGDLPTVRQYVADIAAQVTPERVADVVLAVHEVAANSLVHGAGDGFLTVWSADGDLVLEVVDADGTATVPTMTEAAPGELSGRGLWLAQRLTDAMTIKSTLGRTTVQLRVRLASSDSTAAPQFNATRHDFPRTASDTVE